MQSLPKNRDCRRDGGPDPLTPAAVRRHLDSLTKPPGSLGRLEDLAARLCLRQQTLAPETRPRRLVLFAADHGVVTEGVTAWPSSVTRAMVATIAAGGAASSRLAESTGTSLRVIDVGVEGPPLPDDEIHTCRRIRSGSRNLAREPALTVDEFRAAITIGSYFARRADDDGIRITAVGEMGIGNTTAASCLTALLADAPAEETVGIGAGADRAILARKLAVVQAAVQSQRPRLAAAPEATIAAVCGLEIAAMAGFFRQAAADGLLIVLDGFIATAAALIAERLWPGTTAALLAAHHSAEPGHAVALRHLALEPYLEGWQLRLGEGTGALLLMPLLDAAAAMCRMATLTAAGVVNEA